MFVKPSGMVRQNGLYRAGQYDGWQWAVDEGNAASVTTTTARLFLCYLQDRHYGQ